MASDSVHFKINTAEARQQLEEMQRLATQFEAAMLGAKAAAESISESMREFTEACAHLDTELS
jgi:hypothetical protein